METRRNNEKKRKAPLGNPIIDETTGENVPLNDQEVKEVDEILERFFRGCQGYAVTKIQRIHNPKLEQNYQATRERFEELNKPIDEALMFHGTGHQNLTKYLSPNS